MFLNRVVFLNKWLKGEMYLMIYIIIVSGQSNICDKEFTAKQIIIHRKNVIINTYREIFSSWDWL